MVTRGFEFLDTTRPRLQPRERAARGVLSPVRGGGDCSSRLTGTRRVDMGRVFCYRLVDSDHTGDLGRMELLL